MKGVMPMGLQLKVVTVHNADSEFHIFIVFYKILVLYRTWHEVKENLLGETEKIRFFQGGYPW